MAEILELARQFLTDAVRGREHAHETLHPWRRGWQFVILHSGRVENYALKILEKAPHPLNADEILTLRLAAILHDVARLEGGADHARIGAGIVSEWLSSHPEIARQIPDAGHLLELIANHSQKSVNDGDFASSVLKDADILDEIGAMSIFMTANHLDRTSPFFFEDLSQRLKDFELAYCDKQMQKLQTAAAKEILAEKKKFIEDFIMQLDDELFSGVQNLQILHPRTE